MDSKPNENGNSRNKKQFKKKSRPSDPQASGDYAPHPPQEKDVENNVSNSTIEMEPELEEEETVLSASLNLNLQSNQLTTSIIKSDEEEPLDSARSSPPDLMPSSSSTSSKSVVPEATAPEANLDLPSTVTKLSVNGVTVYLVGTAHFSLESQNDVRKVIQLTQPSLVLLELCHSRRDILSLDEETILREASDIGFKKLRNALSSNSGIQGILHLVLLSMSAQLTKKLGMAPGGEFRAAMQEARKIDKCLVVLGDRPFNITLSRALQSLSIGQKIKLAWQFLTSSDDITKEEIERCKEKDLLEKMLLEMTGEYPSITEVFLTERDAYLAHSLLLAAKHQELTNPVVVGVVGMGHVPGITKFFGTTTDNQISLISRVPVKTQSLPAWLLIKSLKLTFYGLLTYGCYKILSRNSTFQLRIEQLKQIKIRL